MKEQDFDNLIESIKQAGKIRRGEMRPERVFTFSPADIKKNGTGKKLCTPKVPKSPSKMNVLKKFDE